MTLKIERLSDKRGTPIRLSGEFRSEHLDQVKAEIERGGPRADLDLQELDLVDVESVRFLNGARRRVSQCCAARLISGSGCEKHRPISATGEWPVGGRRWKAGMERFTSGNEYQRSQFTGCSKERRNSSARHAVHVTQV